MRYAILVACDPGKPLRPLTADDMPTSFLPLGDRRPLLRRAIDRLAGCIEPDRVWVVIGPNQRARAEKMLPPEAHVGADRHAVGSVQTLKRAAEGIRQAAGDPAEVLVQSATHVVSEEAAYRRSIAAGLDRAREEERAVSFEYEPGSGETIATGIQSWPLDRLIDRLGSSPEGGARAATVLAREEEALLKQPLGAVGWIDASSWDGVRRLLGFVEKPWGHERLWALNRHYAGKVLFIRSGETLSLQYHEVKDETIRILSGRMALHTGRSATGLTCTVLEPGMSFPIPPGLVHRMEALEDCTVMEVSTPQLADVVRLKDRYGRA